MFLAERAHGLDFGGAFCPLRLAVRAEVVFVVGAQLDEAGLGYVDEADFGLGVGGRGGDALGNVLLAAACGLDHLVDGAIAGRKELPAKENRDIVDGFGLLVTDEVLEVAGLPVYWLSCWYHGFKVVKVFKEFKVVKVFKVGKVSKDLKDLIDLKDFKDLKDPIDLKTLRP